MTERDFLLNIIEDQLRRHPGFRVEDLYKMLYQACFGGDHLIKDKAKARKRLQEEWNNTDKIPKGETLIEIIDPRGDVMRINLRIYKKIRGTADRLFDLFVQSAEQFEKDRDRLIRYWGYVMEMVENGEIIFSKSILQDFWIDMGKEGFPAVHHSESYFDANRPAYRIVLKKLWEGFEEKRGDP
jgi:hypothetical protein